MKHYDSNLNIKFEMLCKHPDGLQGGSCPIGSSDCANCAHCRAEMSAADFYKLYNGLYDLRKQVETL